MRKLKESMFQAMLRAGQVTEADRQAALTHYGVRQADLNGDGAPEYLMIGPCGMLCVCRAFFADAKGGMSLVLTAGCMQEGLAVLDGPGENGWKTLMAPIVSYSAGGIKRFYAMREGQYQEIRKECYMFRSQDDARLIRRECPVE